MIQGSASPSNTHNRTALDDRRERSLAPSWLKAGVLGHLTHIAADDGTLDPERTRMSALCKWAYWDPVTRSYRRLTKRAIQYQLALIHDLGVLVIEREAQPRHGLPRVMRLVPAALDTIPADVHVRRKSEGTMPRSWVKRMGATDLFSMGETMGATAPAYVQDVQEQIQDAVPATYAPAARGAESGGRKSVDGFKEWIAAFPIKESIPRAHKAWKDAGLTAADLPVLLAALEWQVTQESWTREGGRWIPRPWNYLRDRRWEDQPFVAPAFVERSKRGQANENAIRGFLNYYDHPDGPAQRLRDHGFDQHAENVWASAEAYAHQRR